MHATPPETRKIKKPNTAKATFALVFIDCHLQPACFSCSLTAISLILKFSLKTPQLPLTSKISGSTKQACSNLPSVPSISTPLLAAFEVENRVRCWLDSNSMEKSRSPSWFVFLIYFFPKIAMVKSGDKIYLLLMRNNSH